MTARQIFVDVTRIPTKGPGDVSGLMELIEHGKIAPPDILAVLGKTEGNGGVNDFTREYAVAALREALAPHLNLTPRAVEERIAFVMSGGTEGVLSPHLTVFARSFTNGADANGNGLSKRLSIGIAHTRDFLPEEIGRTQQIDETVQAVHQAMQDAGIDDASDVHFVQIKCPLLTSERIEAAARRGHKTVTTSGYASMGYSRGASALGVAIALGELDAVDESRLLKDWDLFSSVASSSAGIELMHNVVIVMGNSALSASPFVIGHAVMRDSIDLPAVLTAFESVGLEFPDARMNGRLVNIFAKAEASPDGAVRGFRHTMLDDSDVGSTRHARAAVGGLIGGLSGTGAVYVSGGAEHQGPPGGGPIAVIARA
ncbi:MAG TPA: ring-opening amidohydrolase [Xanthobacteraceae bacterium]|jgi:cyanuric acid amidohydrolase|nr:ring-opening amidohydrolase [Xanthobacteraceae bacterium]